jgi:hypothetical protein
MAACTFALKMKVKFLDGHVCVHRLENNTVRHAK